MLSPELATVHALRSDVAHQIARYVQRLGINQVRAAAQLGIPQPTLSKIINGHTSALSLELLIRIAVRARMPMTMQTGLEAQEAGAFVSGGSSASRRAFPSEIANQARESVKQAERELSPSERLEAFLEHNQLVGALYEAGRAAEAERAISTPLIR